MIPVTYIHVYRNRSRKPTTVMETIQLAEDYGQSGETKSVEWAVLHLTWQRGDMFHLKSPIINVKRVTEEKAKRYIRAECLDDHELVYLDRP